MPAGYLEQSLDEWDHHHFGLTPREVEDIDPVQAIFLEVVWEALSAAQWPDGFQGSDTGVFAGSIWTERIADSRPGYASTFTATGSALSMVANRASYTFDLRGPSFTLDSACSSSLVAVHLAASSLRQGECRAAVVGGVNLLQSENTMSDLIAFGGLSSDGKCKPFQKEADGFGRGEGAVALLLKRLPDALADGDQVMALIRGTAINNDGRSNGLTAPSPIAQEQVIRSAHNAGGTNPAKVAYVETHGTGTSLGDPIEASAISAALQSQQREQPVALGALKETIGHLEGAAGIAGMAKAVLAVSHQRVPAGRFPGLPNPHIDMVDLGLQPTRNTVALNQHDLVGVSSFGWGGTNAHVVLESSPSLLTHQSLVSDPSNVCFVFSPYGSQWVGAARDLLSLSLFRRSIQQTDIGVRAVLGWSVFDVITAAEEFADAGPDVWQPVVHAIQVGLAAVLRDSGIEPAVVVGHSLGEIAAAVAIGAIDPVEGGRVVAHYASAQQKLVGLGDDMAVVEIDPVILDELLAAMPQVTIAGYNSPGSVNLAGPSTALDEIINHTLSRGGRGAMISVGLAAHSPSIDDIADYLATALGTVEVMPSAVPMVSTVTGEIMDLAQLSGRYFVDGLRQPVQLMQALQHELVQRCSDVLEINSRPVLTDSLNANCKDQNVCHAYGRDGLWVSPSRADDSSVVITASAPTTEGLAARMQQISKWAVGRNARDVATTSASMPNLNERAYAVVSATDELPGAWVHTTAVSSRKPGLVLVFPGQGGQWLGMGRLSFVNCRSFERHIRRCDQAFQSEANLSILEWFNGDLHTIDSDRVDVVQPALFSFQVATAMTIREAGVPVSAVIGHSMGELAAAHVAGHITLNDAAAVIGRRSQLMQRLAGEGAMLVTELASDEAHLLVEQHESLSIAAFNSPTSTVISGPMEAVARAAEELSDRDVFQRLVRVSVASHCALMDPILDDLRSELAGVSRRVGDVAWFSTVLGRKLEDSDDVDVNYWVDNLRQPVLFASAAKEAIQNAGIVVEISPHPVLAPATREIATMVEGDVDIVSMFSRDSDDFAQLCSVFGELWRLDVNVEPTTVHTPGKFLGAIAPFPFQRETRSIRRRSRHFQKSFPGDRIALPGDEFRATWIGGLSIQTSNCHDHIVQGRAIAPASLLMKAFFRIVSGGTDETMRLSNFAMTSSVELDTDLIEVRIAERRVDAGTLLTAETGEDNATFATGCITGGAKMPSRLKVADTVRRPRDLAELNHAFDKHGLSFGSQYQRIARVELGIGTVNGLIPHRQGERTTEPAVLDAIFQCGILPIIEHLDSRRTPVSVSFDSVWIKDELLRSDITAYCLVKAGKDGWSADIDATTEDDELLVSVRGMRIVGIANAKPQSSELDASTKSAVRSYQEVIELVCTGVAQVCGLDPKKINPSTPFQDLGLSSILALELKVRLEQVVGFHLRATMVWNYPTINELASHIFELIKPPLQEEAPVESERSVPVAVKLKGGASELTSEIAELESMLEEL